MACSQLACHAGFTNRFLVSGMGGERPFAVVRKGKFEFNTRKQTTVVAEHVDVALMVLQWLWQCALRAAAGATWMG